MRGDVLKSITASKDVTSVVILTHNIDFIFLQTVVLAALRKSGSPTITVFADAQCAAESYQYQAELLDGLGVRYRVVPVAMSTGYRFHPKAILLSGDREASLLVGSGNLTFGGWRENGEVWTRFDTASNGAAVFLEFRAFLERVLARVPIAGAVRAEIDAAFNGQWRTDRPTGPQHLLGRVGDGLPLFDAMRDACGTEPIDGLSVCTPYFDRDGAALRALGELAPRGETLVYCNPKQTTLTRSAFSNAGANARRENVEFHHLVGNQSRHAFLHAKVYAFRQAESALVLAGSANCSRAALLTRGTDGNAELMVVRRMSIEDLKSVFGELTKAPDEELPETFPEETARHASVRVLAARLDAGTLFVAYAPIAADVRSCEIDETRVAFHVMERGLLSVVATADVSSMRIEANIDGKFVWSPPTWIDHERHLRTSSRERTMAETVRSRVQPGVWSAPKWAEIMDVFCKHLTFTPMRAMTGDARPRSDPSELSTFTSVDVFSRGYATPTLHSLTLKVDGGKERSLQQLLLRWFGVTDGANTTAEFEPEPDDADSGGEEGDSVDHPEPLPAQRVAPQPLTDSDRKRIQKVLTQVEVAMTATTFLSDRPIDLLAADLKVTAVLLRVALREDWIDGTTFFHTTHRVWSPLFFGGSPESKLGWLAYRLQQTESRWDAAATAPLRSPSFAAALLGWAFAVAPVQTSPAAARFHFAVALAVARLPWLWDGGDANAVAKELELLIANTALEGVAVATVHDDWLRTMKRGHALLRFEEAVREQSLSSLRERIGARDLQAGDLLWQGKAGYCVVITPPGHDQSGNVRVLRLQHDDESAFLAKMAVPMSALLKPNVLPLTDSFGAEPRRVLMDFLDELRTGLAPNASKRLPLVSFDD